MKRRASTTASRSAKRRSTSTTAYPARAIIDESNGQYKIDWEPDPHTGEPFDPSWEPTKNATLALIAAWERDKASKNVPPQRSILGERDGQYLISFVDLWLDKDEADPALLREWLRRSGTSPQPSPEDNAESDAFDGPDPSAQNLFNPGGRSSPATAPQPNGGNPSTQNLSNADTRNSPATTPQPSPEDSVESDTFNGRNPSTQNLSNADARNSPATAPQPLPEDNAKFDALDGGDPSTQNLSNPGGRNSPETAPQSSPEDSTKSRDPAVDTPADHHPYPK